MVMASLHIICGNCGRKDALKFKVDPEGSDYTDEEEKFGPSVDITCENCGTLHDLSETIKEES